MKMLPITGCKQCPHMKQITSPYTGDSFDAGDVDSICTHPQVSQGEEHKGQYKSVFGRVLSVSDRPWQADKELATIPKWCPL